MKTWKRAIISLLVSMAFFEATIGKVLVREEFLQTRRTYAAVEILFALVVMGAVLLVSSLRHRF